MTARKTRIKCSDNKFRTLVIHKDSILENGSDITQDVERIVSMLRLGKAPADPGTCACLAALVLYGCEIILRREPNGSGDQPLDGWRDIYIRFESNKLVEHAMNRTRARLRRERKRQSSSPPTALAGGAA